NRVGTYRPANEEDLGGRIVTVNTHRYLRAIGEHLCFGGIRRGRHHDLLSVPVEPDGDNAGRTVAPVVGQMGQTLRLQQVLSNRIMKQANISLLCRHECLLSFGGATLLTREHKPRVSSSIAESSEAHIRSSRRALLH